MDFRAKIFRTQSVRPMIPILKRAAHSRQHMELKDPGPPKSLNSFLKANDKAYNHKSMVLIFEIIEEIGIMKYDTEDAMKAVWEYNNSGYNQSAP